MSEESVKKLVDQYGQPQQLSVSQLLSQDKKTATITTIFQFSGGPKLKMISITKGKETTHNWELI